MVANWLSTPSAEYRSLLVEMPALLMSMSRWSVSRAIAAAAERTESSESRSSTTVLTTVVPGAIPWSGPSLDWQQWSVRSVGFFFLPMQGERGEQNWDTAPTALVTATTSRQLAAMASSLAGERDAKRSSAGEWRASANTVASPMDPGDGTLELGRSPGLAQTDRNKISRDLARVRQSTPDVAPCPPN